MQHKHIYIAAAFISSALLSGCMPSGPGGGSSSAGSEPVTSETYQYKGRKDPLMATSAADRAAVMAERFKMIQGRT